MFSEFFPSSKEQWEEIARRDLNREDITSEISWNISGGIRMFPFVTRDDIDYSSTVPIRRSAAWKICDFVNAPKLSEANTVIKKASDGGSEACLIQLHYSEAQSEGLKIRSNADFNQLTDGIDMAGLELIFETVPACFPHDVRARIFSENVSATLVENPVSDHIKNQPVQLEQLKGSISTILEADRYKLYANGTVYYYNGDVMPRELGTTLAIASEYLVQTDKENRSELARSIIFKLASGPLFFPGIAKFRAMRILWHHLLKAFELEAEPATIFAETAEADNSVAEPYKNLLQTVTEAMAAISGGADLLIVKPFRESDDFSMRMARNIQHILRDEAYFDKVADPAAGSYYIEQLTRIIVEKSWKYFQQIEKNGGFLNMLSNGSFPEVAE